MRWQKLEILHDNPFKNGSEFGVGNINNYEAIDYRFAKLGLDITSMPLPRVMGLYRMMRVEDEIEKVESNKNNGGIK